MIISRGFKSRLPWAGLALVMLACISPFAASLPPTDTIIPQTQPPLPTLSLLESTATLSTSQLASVPTDIPTPTITAEPDRIWSQGPLGADTLTIRFYAGSKAARCISLSVNNQAGREIASTGGCAPSGGGTVYAIRANVVDSKGAPFTIVAGRAFDSQIAVMSVEFSGGDNIPAEIRDGGFMNVSEGKLTVIAVVPIDQYGNLVGSRFIFK